MGQGIAWHLKHLPERWTGGTRRLRATTAYRASRGTYGAPRILVDLQEGGTRTSKRRCARLMREQGLQGRKKHRRRPRTTDTWPEAKQDRAENNAPLTLSL